MHEPLPPSSLKDKLPLLGPGLIAAATGVGAGDLIAALVAGTNYGVAFIWAILLGSLLKYTLNEGVGRYHLVTGQTLLQGWRTLGRWTLVYFGAYLMIWGFIYGAAGPTSTALAATAMFPQLSFNTWAIVHSLLAFVLIFLGRYQLFERVMTALTGLMFVTVVGSAVLIFPDWTKIFSGLIPNAPDSSFIFVLGLIGGVGGSITMASYGYWIKEKRWSSPAWLSVMRLDSGLAYALTAIFTLSLLIVGAEFLYGSGIVIQDEKGLITLARMLGDKFGTPVRWLFLLGFWSASFTSVLGVWNGVSYLFADWMRQIKREPETTPISTTSPTYRFYVAWLTFPPMLLLFWGKPVSLVILYGVLGALFMPFLAITLLFLLNAKQLDDAYRNRWLTNLMLWVGILLFAILAIKECLELFQ
ncbi:Nramp family divalent metal transporter [Laceyella sacchari]|uniref:Nramp family divalent metal transporter n=1 Tax=Laceyella sacchari TaxID=37482 RepID=A0ABY5U577_LACSH|nr:Nramp family divalent metal transporter [Laceyella sacchari]UWE04150.1 Nramp family divalent metal transporter [Laceyella sacchari]